MATNAAALKASPEQSADAPAKKSGKKGLILAVVVALLLGAGGAGGWFWWQKQHDASTKEKGDKGDKGGKESKKDKEKDKPDAPPSFVNIDQMVVNLNGGDHYLQTAIVLSVSSGEAAEVIKTYMPIIRNRILLLLSSKQAEEIAKPEAKVELANEILAQTREALPGGKDDDEEKGIKAVLFSNFIIQ